MLDSDEVTSIAELARLGRVSRARITQIMDLMMLAPEIQEDVVFGKLDVGLGNLIPAERTVIWSEQRLWLRASRRSCSGGGNYLHAVHHECDLSQGDA
jgi:hypothetical protein